MPSDYQKKKLAKKKEASKIKGGKKPTTSAQNDAAENGGSDNEVQTNGSAVKNGDDGPTELTYEGNSRAFISE